ncbi:MAG: hypothetical protein NTX36_12590 [Proteobacteria bacterium]|nr:hypothetical protein [Pseudomonadota bacterium]
MEQLPIIGSDTRLFVLGVIHRDESGHELLHEWMKRIKPDVITLEFSNYRLMFRKERGAELDENYFFVT